MSGKNEQVPFYKQRTSFAAKLTQRAFAELVINAIPNDGCVLVFNVKRPNMFRQAVSRLCPGLLWVHYCDRLPMGAPQPATRDLYIRWRED